MTPPKAPTVEKIQPTHRAQPKGFVYVGVEVGIPGTLNFYISDTTANGGGFINGTALANAAAIGGFVAGTYWLLMLVGRLCSSFIADKVSSRMMMMIANGAGMIFIVLAVLSASQQQ